MQDEVAATLRDRPLGIAEYFLWFLSNGLPCSLYQRCVETRPEWTVLEQLTKSATLQTLSGFMGLPSPAKRMTDITLHELAFASKCLTDPEQTLCMREVDPGVWNVVVEWRDWLGPVREVEARQAAAKVLSRLAR